MFCLGWILTIKIMNHVVRDGHKTNIQRNLQLAISQRAPEDRGTPLESLVP